MRSIGVDNMTEDMQNSIVNGLNNLFFDYFRDKEITTIVDYTSHSLLSNWWEMSMSSVFTNNIPYGIAYEDDIDIYTLETVKKGVLYVPHMLLNEEKKDMSIAITEIGSDPLSYMLRKLIRLMFNQRYDTAVAFWRVAQSIVKIKGTFKEMGKFTAFEKDETRHPDNKTPKLFTRRSLR